MHYANSMHKAIRKEEIKCLLHETKGGVDDQKCFLFTTAAKTNPGQCRFFYRIFDSSIVNSQALKYFGNEKSQF